jgi:hypothetical protein
MPAAQAPGQKKNRWLSKDSRLEETGTDSRSGRTVGIALDEFIVFIVARVLDFLQQSLFESLVRS